MPPEWVDIEDCADEVKGDEKGCSKIFQPTVVTKKLST